MVFNRFSAGKKVYARGAHRPTAGRVNPAGYIAREARNRAKKRSVSRVGRDGQSDTRSGLAKAAIARTQSMTGSVPKTAPGAPIAMKPVSTMAPAPVPGQVPRPGAPVTETGNMSQPAGTPAVPQVPHIQINPNGTLDLPYDIQATSDLLAQKEAANTALLDLQSAEQQQALDFTTQRRDLDIDYEGIRREALNRASGRGTAFSSGYGVDVGNNARDYNNVLNDLIAGNNAFQQDATKQRNNIVTNFNDFVRKEALDRAARLAEQAGKLGYGKNANPTTGTKDPGKVKQVPRKPKPKPKGKGKAVRVKPKRPTGKKPMRPTGKPRPRNVKLTPAEIRRRAAAKKRAASAAKNRKK